MFFGTLTYTLGCFPLDIRPYHRTSETIILNNTFLSFTHIGTHLYALLTFLVLLPTPSHDAYGVSETKWPRIMRVNLYCTRPVPYSTSPLPLRS